MKNSWNERDDIIFTISYILARSPHILKPHRKMDGTVGIIATSVLDHLERSGWRLVKVDRSGVGK